MPSASRHSTARSGTFAFLMVSLILLVLAGGFTSSAQAAQTQIEAILRAANLGDTEVAIMAVDLTSGDTLVRLNADKPMIPASNMKLLTSAAALSILGPEYVFRTELRVLKPDDWIARFGQAPSRLPDLLVKGDGDPAFGDPDLLSRSGLDVEKLIEIWVDAVKRTGITAFHHLIVDDRILDRQWVHPDWPEDQLDRWYCAEVAGLNFHDNCLDLYPEPTRYLDSPRVRLSPNVNFVRTLNRAKTDNRTDAFWAARKPGTNEITFYGKVRRQAQVPVSITIHQPPLFFGQLLAERLLAAGISVQEVILPSHSQAIPTGKAIHIVQTTLPLILARCNKDSQNLFAEALIKRLGHEETGVAGSWDNGAAAIRIFLRDRIGARAAAIDIADGSGMSRRNAVSAHLFIDLLVAMQQDRKLYPHFRDSLSIAGSDGTLRARLQNLDGTIYGKSGYIREVSGLTGYMHIPSPSGADGGDRLIAFSILFNGFKPPLYNHHMRTVQDQIVTVLHERVRQRQQRMEIGG